MNVDCIFVDAGLHLRYGKFKFYYPYLFKALTNESDRKPYLNVSLLATQIGNYRASSGTVLKVIMYESRASLYNSRKLNVISPTSYNKFDNTPSFNVHLIATHFICNF